MSDDPLVQKELAELDEIQQILTDLGFFIGFQVDPRRDGYLALGVNEVGWAFIKSMDLPLEVSAEMFLKLLREKMKERDTNLDLIERGEW